LVAVWEWANLHYNNAAMSSDRRFNTIWNVFKILIAVTLAGYVFTRTDLNELISLGGQLVPHLIVATFLLYTSLTLFKAVKYQILLQQRTSYWRVLNVVVMQNALSNFLANSVGIASYLTLLKVEEKVRLGRSGLVFLITKIGDLFAVWVVMVISTALFWERIAELHQVVLILEAVIGAGFVFFFAALFFRKFFISIFNSFLQRFHLIKLPFVGDVAQVLDAFAEMEERNILRIVFIAFGLSLVYYMFTLLWMVTSLRAFGLEAETWVIVFVSGALQLFSFFPVTIFGGLGITEVTSLYLYSLFGVEQEGLTAILVGWRVLYYLANLFVLTYLPFYTLLIERKIKPRTAG
jgi:uncharacterized membrane protein YbhN (UPF0104 family)